jgi:hypothetical protein
MLCGLRDSTHTCVTGPRSKEEGSGAGSRPLRRHARRCLQPRHPRRCSGLNQARGCPVVYKGKGGNDNSDNYRLTVLQPTPVKTLGRTVDLRLRELTDTRYVSVSVEQGGFRTHRSTYDSTFLLQSLRDGAKQHKAPLYAAFLGVKKAFDSVSHSKLLRVLSQQGVPQAWVGLFTTYSLTAAHSWGTWLCRPSGGLHRGLPCLLFSSLFSRSPSPSGRVQGLQG